MQALLEKRARAAAVITALGRGFQGRQEARRLRVNWHNAAAAKIQDHFRARAARRYCSKQCAFQVQEIGVDEIGLDELIN